MVVVVRAVLVDIGGVLERVSAPDAWVTRWQRRLGIGAAEFGAARAGVDPDNLMVTGGMTEVEYQRRWAQALGLSDVESAEFLADMWDWYCGELDTELAAYVAGLRPGLRTGIVSNSADGARREEQRRYRLADLVDTIVYSHEVGIAKPDRRIFALACARLQVAPAEAAFLDDVPDCVQAARRYGMHAVLHLDTPTSIAAIDALTGS